MAFRVSALPTSASSVSGTLNTESSINNGAWTTASSLRSDGVLTLSAYLALPNSGQVAFAGRSQITSPADGRLLIRNTAGTGVSSLEMGPASATASSAYIEGQDATGTDKSGGGLELDGGQSTGSGRGGNVVVRTSTTSTTGSSANAYQDRARYVPKYIDLTDNTATTLFTVTLPTTNTIGMQFVCTVQASDGTDFQTLTTPVTVDAVAKSTTITTVVAPTAAQTTLAGSAGTLSVTYTVVDAGSNVLAVKVTADTSFGSPTYLRAKVVMTAINGMGAGWSITEI